MFRTVKAMSGMFSHFNLNMFVSRNIPIATLNVPGIAQRKKQCKQKRLLIEEIIDVIAVQETELACLEQTGKCIEPSLSGYDVCVSHGVETYAGFFLVMKNYLPRLNCIVTNENGRLIWVGCEMYTRSTLEIYDRTRSKEHIYSSPRLLRDVTHDYFLVNVVSLVYNTVPYVIP